MNKKIYAKKKKKKIILNREFAWAREIIQKCKLWILGNVLTRFRIWAQASFSEHLILISSIFDKMFRNLKKPGKIVITETSKCSIRISVNALLYK